MSGNRIPLKGQKCLVDGHDGGVYPLHATPKDNDTRVIGRKSRKTAWL